MCSRLSCAKWQVSGQAALCCVKILKHKTIFQRNANLNVFVLTWIKWALEIKLYPMLNTDSVLFAHELSRDDSQHAHTSNLFTVHWVFERISSVWLHISADRHYFFPQFLLAEIWVFDLFKMQSDSSTPESEREAHDCATKFEGLNAVTHREGVTAPAESLDSVTGIQ